MKNTLNDARTEQKLVRRRAPDPPVTAAAQANAPATAALALQRARSAPRTLSPADVLAVQRAAGNRAASSLLQPPAGPTLTPVLEAVQRAATAPVSSAPGDLGARIRSAAGGGSPLSSAVRETIEPGLNANLSGVRVHTDGEADRLSQAVQAVAFTSGSDIFFRQGTYNPSSQQGLHLLAHEAAHTVQQARGPVAGTPHPGGVSISDPGDRFERAATQAAAQVSAGVAAPTAQRTVAPTAPEQVVPLQRQAYTTSSLGSVPIQRWALNTAKTIKSIPAKIPWSNTQSIATSVERTVLFFHDATDTIVVKGEKAPIGMTVLVKGLHQQVHGTPTVRTKDVTGDRATILAMINNAGLTSDASWTKLGNSGAPDKMVTATGAPIVDANDTPEVKARKLQRHNFADLPKVHAMAFAQGQSAEDLMTPAKQQSGDQSAIRALLMDPAHLQRLGMITAVDFFLENVDRVLAGNVGNWFVDDKAVTLIDNLDSNARGLWKSGTDTNTGPLDKINHLTSSQLQTTAKKCIFMMVNQLHLLGDKSAKAWAKEAYQGKTRNDFMQEHFLRGLTKGRERIIALYAVKGLKKSFSGKTQDAKKGLKKLQGIDAATGDWDTGSERYWERLKARARWLEAN